MKKKLAILLYRYFPYGGLQKDFLGITKELLARGHEIKVYTRSWEGDVPENLDVVELGEKGFSNYSKNKTYVSIAFSSLKSFFPDIVFGFNKMPGLDLYFAADTCFAKQSLKRVLYKNIQEDTGSLWNLKKKYFLEIQNLKFFS